MHDFFVLSNRRQELAWAAGLAALLSLTGCLAPKYRRPSSPTPPAYKESTGTWKTASPADTLPRGKWWELFGDARLNELEAKVLVSNQSIKQAEAQYQEARALVAFSRAGYFPTITAQPSATRQYSPSGGPSGPRNYSDTFSLPVTASWEPDLWGQVRYATRGAAAQAQASAAQLENARLSLQAELAAVYFTLEADDMQQVTLSTAIASYEESLKLTKIRFEGGVASEVDVAQARTQLETTRAQATDLALARTQLEHAIAVLVGEPPSTFSLDFFVEHRRDPRAAAGYPDRSAGATSRT
jgi:NodT family efflux transporter outer membrane factor (OMF) lipoprotein